MNQLNKIWAVDWLRITEEAIRGLNDGTMKLVDGVIYWARDSGNTGIYEHVKFKQLEIDGSGELSKVINTLPSGGAASVAVPIVISTTVILGAIVVQTAYLSNKINKLQKQVDILSLEINNQNYLFLLEKVTRYFGLIETAKEYLIDPSISEEIKGVAEHLLSDLSVNRNEMLSLVDNLLDYYEQFSIRQREYVLDFIQLMLTLFPKGIYIEKILHARIGNVYASQVVFDKAKQAYLDVIDSYRIWSEKKFKDFIGGLHDGDGALIEKNLDIAKEILFLEENKYFLDGD